MKHIGPLSNVKAIFDPGCGKYPSRVRLAMEDGTIRTFWGEAPQPKPKRWNPIHEIIGYPRKKKYQPRHAKKDRRCCNTDRQVRELFLNHHITKGEQ